MFVAQGVLIFLLHKAGIKTPAVPWPSGARPGRDQRAGTAFVWVVDNIAIYLEARQKFETW